MSSLSLEVHKPKGPASGLWAGYFKDDSYPERWSGLYDLGALSSLDSVIL